MSKSAYIFGSGFGLYGYLPALNLLGYRAVYMDSRYRERLFSRPDLRNHTEIVRFSAFNAGMFEDENFVIIFAKRPCDQEAFLRQAIQANQVKATLLLEKPLAQNPDAAIKFIDELVGKNISFRINYILKYAPWYRLLDPANSYRIKWLFKAHHFRNNAQNWKRFQNSGGGVLRFYGIHLLNAFFALYGEESKTVRLISMDETWERIELELVGVSDRSMIIEIDSNNEMEIFSIENRKNNGLVFQADSPFGTTWKNISEYTAGGDPRISLLSDFIKSGDEVLESKTLLEYRRTEMALSLLEQRA